MPASKLMQTLLKVSTATLLTMNIPIGMPKRTDGEMTVNSVKLWTVKRPSR
jgi:hypothetical protein